MVDGKFIPEDTLVYPQLYSVLKDDPIFENPNEFRPSRFLEADGRTVNKVCENVHLSSIEIIAEGNGTHDCVWHGQKTVRGRG